MSRRGCVMCTSPVKVAMMYVYLIGHRHVPGRAVSCLTDGLLPFPPMGTTYAHISFYGRAIHTFRLLQPRRNGSFPPSQSPAESRRRSPTLAQPISQTMSFVFPYPMLTHTLISTTGRGIIGQQTCAE